MVSYVGSGATLQSAEKGASRSADHYILHEVRRRIGVKKNEHVDEINQTDKIVQFEGKPRLDLIWENVCFASFAGEKSDVADKQWAADQLRNVAGSKAAPAHVKAHASELADGVEKEIMQLHRETNMLPVLTGKKVQLEKKFRDGPEKTGNWAGLLKLMHIGKKAV